MKLDCLFQTGPILSAVAATCDCIENAICKCVSYSVSKSELLRCQNLSLMLQTNMCSGRAEPCWLGTHYCRVREGLGSQSLVICVDKYSRGESRQLLGIYICTVLPNSGVLCIYSCPICTWVVFVGAYIWKRHIYTRHYKASGSWGPGCKQVQNTVLPAQFEIVYSSHFLRILQVLKQAEIQLCTNFETTMLEFYGCDWCLLKERQTFQI